MRLRLVTLILACAGGFAHSRMLAQHAQLANTTVQVHGTVITLPPKVVSEQVIGNANARDLGAIESTLAEGAASELKARQYAITMPEGLQDSEATEGLKQLQLLSSRVVRGAFNDEAKQILGYLTGLQRDYLILVQFVRIKEGPRGSWNPMNGAITSGMSSTFLQAALISTKTGQVVWKNEVLERRVLAANDPKLEKDLSLLYKTLIKSGGNL